MFSSPILEKGSRLKRGLLSWLLHTKGKFSEYQLTRKETLPTFRLDALVFFRAKVKLDANTCYLLAAHIKKSNKTRHRMSREVRGRPEPAPPCNLLRVAVQQPGSSSPASRLNRSSAGVIWMWRASFSSSSFGLLAWSTISVSSHLMGCWFSQACSAIADLSTMPLLQAS